MDQELKVVQSWDYTFVSKSQIKSILNDLLGVVSTTIIETTITSDDETFVSSITSVISDQITESEEVNFIGLPDNPLFIATIAFLGLGIAVFAIIRFKK